MRLRAVCPAATAVDGTPGSGPAILCGAAALENDRPIEIGAGPSPVLTLREDGPIVAAFCCGRGLPQIDPRSEDVAPHYTACPTWLAEKERIWESKRRLVEASERGRTADEILQSVRQGVR